MQSFLSKTYRIKKMLKTIKTLRAEPKKTEASAFFDSLEKMIVFALYIR